MFRGPGSGRLEGLLSILVVLGIVLVGFELVSRILSFLGLFRQEILLFILGALLAFILTPLVGLVQKVVRRRWLAIATSYLGLLIVIVLFGFLLINPFIRQVRGLIGNLDHPAARSLTALRLVGVSAHNISREIDTLVVEVQSSTTSVSGHPDHIRVELANLHARLGKLEQRREGRSQVRVPASYLRLPMKDLSRASRAYHKWTTSPSNRDIHTLLKASTFATRGTTTLSTVYRKAASTPIILLNLQVWLDGHGISLDLHDKFGSALQQVSRQVSSILNGALSLALEAGNLLLSTVLVLLISIYFLADGSRFINWLIQLVPGQGRNRVAFLAARLDAILGSYLRTMLVIAFLAATLSAVGAFVLGVPYAVVIFFSSFFLSLIPVIGPVVLPIPAVLIAMIFTPMPVPLIYLVWLLVTEQLATNVIGPRLQGRNVGIHPLEAMAAALIGFPLAGFIGAFFAVPVAAFLHVVVREFYHTATDVGGPVPPLRPVPDPAGSGTLTEV